MKWMRRLTIRWRITLGSVAVAVVLLAAATIGFRAQMAAVLLHADQDLLYSASGPYVAAVEKHPDQLDHPAEDQRIAVVDSRGVSRVNTLPDSLRDEMKYLTSLSPGFHITQPGTTSYLVRIRHVGVGEERWTVMAAVSQHGSMIVLDNLTNLLVLGALGLLLGFGIASWLLTSAALGPVNRMRQRAAELSTNAASEPLPVGPAKDEISDLATTLNEFIDALRSAAAREKQMVADASHELRTPIAVLKAQLELAHLSEGDAAALLADLRSAEVSVNALSRLATGLLELSTLESGYHHDSSTGQLLADEFADASDRARLLGAQKSITVEFELVAGALDDTYAIDSAHLARVIDNLVGNAIEATPPGGHVRVTMEAERSHLVLDVTDTGPGMPEDFIPIAFDRFSRPDEARGRQGGGAGLGLSIVSAIVHSAGGYVTIRNQEGSGLAVSVTIPSSTAPGG